MGVPTHLACHPGGLLPLMQELCVFHDRHPTTPTWMRRSAATCSASSSGSPRQANEASGCRCWAAGAARLTLRRRPHPPPWVDSGHRGRQALRRVRSVLCQGRRPSGWSSRAGRRSSGPGSPCQRRPLWHRGAGKGWKGSGSGSLNPTGVLRVSRTYAGLTLPQAPKKETPFRYLLF